MAELGMKSPIFLPGPVEPQFGPGRYLTFEGFSVDEHGKQHYMDATVAYRQTCLRVIEYLRRFGYDDYQIYLLLSCAPVQGHIAGIVDVSCAHVLCIPCELTVLYRFRTRALQWVFLWTSSTLTSVRTAQRRSRIWDRAHMPASDSTWVRGGYGTDSVADQMPRLWPWRVVWGAELAP
jgi:hypothetical protein